MNHSALLTGGQPGRYSDVRNHVIERSMRARLVPFRMSPEGCAIVRALAPKHYPTSDAPSTLESLLAAWDEQSDRGLPVWDGASDATIYEDDATNFAFRAWHDMLHVAHQAPFNGKGEREVALKQCRMARNAGMKDRDIDALFFDVWGQFVYSELHDGEFPEDQALFVAACFEYGIDTAAGMTF